MKFVALIALIALAGCSRPVLCTVETATSNPLAQSTGRIENSKDVIIHVTRVDQEPGEYRLNGTMENASGRTLSAVQIQCKFIDKDGHTVSSDDDYGFNMKPGEAKNLSIRSYGQGDVNTWSCAVLEARS